MAPPTGRKAERFWAAMATQALNDQARLDGTDAYARRPCRRFFLDRIEKREIAERVVKAIMGAHDVSILAEGAWPGGGWHWDYIGEPSDAYRTEARTIDVHLRVRRRWAKARRRRHG